MTTLIFTIGHSTHPIDRFLCMLQSFHIGMLADVRTIPKSRFNPQFDSDNLKGSLEAQSIGYIHYPGLGGLRHSRKDSINKGWRNLSFRGYADYMQTPEFVKNLDLLIDRAKETQISIMCAEAVPWRCHRSLIGDALLVRGFEVEDIFSEKISKPHRLTSWAKVDGLNITYPNIIQGRIT